LKNKNKNHLVNSRITGRYWHNFTCNKSWSSS